ncbi:MAG: hypothetical protein C4B55_06905 [Candidatus Methanophagaceae archaeon]|nr:MAG: hypothetical protein C4B55_06905 [Methanophagales archaeon]
MIGVYADLGRLVAALKEFRWTFLFVLSALTTTNYLFRFLKWDFFLKRAGVGDLEQIEIVGLERRAFERLNFGFEVKKSPIIKGDQILRKKTANVKWLHRLLFFSPVFKAFIFGSEFYHDRLWYFNWEGEGKGVYEDREGCVIQKISLREVS